MKKLPSSLNTLRLLVEAGTTTYLAIAIVTGGSEAEIEQHCMRARTTRADMPDDSRLTHLARAYCEAIAVTNAKELRSLIGLGPAGARNES
jgi:hypothetical protein